MQMTDTVIVPDTDLAPGARNNTLSDSDEDRVPPKNPGFKLQLSRGLGPNTQGGKENKATDLFGRFRFRTLGVDATSAQPANPASNGFPKSTIPKPRTEQELQAFAAVAGPSHMDLISDDEDQPIAKPRRAKRGLLLGDESDDEAQPAGRSTPAKRTKVDFGDTDEDTPWRPQHIASTPSDVIDLASAEPSRLVQPATHAVDGGALVIDDEAYAAALQAEEAEEVEEEPANHDKVLEECQKIAQKLRKQLGGSVGDRYAATEQCSEVLLSQQDLQSACGKMALRLKSYQLVGINFLMLHHRVETEGVILADEMGLGKTAQSICFLGALMSKEGDRGPHLIIVPPSLLDNWLRELATWCPALRVVTYYGSKRQYVRAHLNNWRRAKEAGLDPGDLDLSALTEDGLEREERDEDGGSSQEEDESEESEADEDEPWRKRLRSQSREPSGGVRGGASSSGLSSSPFDVLITCYTLFERDSPEQRIDREFLRKWQWSYMVVDEAHALKNRASQRTLQLRRLAQQCRQRIMLTGTPLQNDLGELCNMMQFLLPTVFKNMDDVEYLENMEAEAKEQLTTRMRNLLAPFLLRRLKSEVAGQLAEKQQMVQEVDMVACQAQLYKEALTDLRAEVDRSASQKRSKSSTGKVNGLGQRRIKHLFSHLRKIAQHPLLVRHLFDNSTVTKMAKIAHGRSVFGDTASLQRVEEEMLSYNDHQLNNLAHGQGGPFSSFTLDSQQYMESAKCKLLAELLPELKRKGSRPLIFSQWTSVLDVLEEVLHMMGLSFARLDGSTAVEDRILLVDRFNDPNSGLFAFLLSTRAGGQGLNLTGADTVILHDVDFNPQIDRQAEDRCHRIGQTKAVTVYRLITKGTVDENIHAISQRKLDLDAAVLDGITAGSDKQSAAAEGKLMANILHQLINDKASESAIQLD